MAEENSMIVGAQAGLRVMVDGTVRITVDIEPKDRIAAMTLFGSPGQSIAMAALKAGYAAASPKPASRTWADRGQIEKEALELSNNKVFQRYVARVTRVSEAPEPACKAFICSTCNVDSRQDLDTAEGARELFIAHIRTPYLAWRAKQAEQA